MAKKNAYVLLLCFLWLFASCKSPKNVGIKDIIRPVVLTAGHPDTVLVSDLFYAKSYPLILHPSGPVRAVYDESTGKMILEPTADFEGYSQIEFELNGQSFVIPTFVRIKQKHIFKFRPAAGPHFRVNIMGTFNDWNRNSLPMQDRDGDGLYEIEMELDPGQYLYQFVIDNREIWDPENPVKVDNGFGSFNSVVVVPPRHATRAVLHVMGHETHENNVILNFMYAGDGALPVAPGQTLALLDNAPIPKQSLKCSGETVRIILEKRDLAGQHVVRVAVTRTGQASNLQTVYLRDGVPAGEGENMVTWHDAIIYALMPDRFFNANPGNDQPVQHDSLAAIANYMGGDFQGILEKMRAGYFDSLGVNTVWLYPVNQNTNHAFREYPPPHRYYAAYHGYWPTHHEKVEEHFGDMQLLQELVKTAHEHGIKILIDFIANHVHREHPFFREHRDWFGSLELPDGRKNLRLWDEHRLTTWFEPYLPSFDYLGSEEALETMTDNAVWWLRQTGADGFRHDAVKHVPNKFWRRLTRKLKEQVEIPRQKPLYQIGETFGSYGLISSYVNNGQLNAQFNFNLYDTALYVFLNPEVSFSILERELQKTFAVYGMDHLMGNIMDSHDKTRYMAYADGDIALNSNEASELAWTNPPRVDHESSYAKARLYLAYMLTIPGVPTLYYGDEIGMTGAADPDNRRMMRFGDALTRAEKNMLEQVRKLVHLRRAHSALRYGDFLSLLANPQVFVYLRSDMRERVLIALNKSTQDQEVTVELPEFYGLNQAVDLISGAREEFSKNAVTLQIPALGWKILQVYSADQQI